MIKQYFSEREKEERKRPCRNLIVSNIFKSFHIKQKIKISYAFLLFFHGGLFKHPSAPVLSIPRCPFHFTTTQVFCLHSLLSLLYFSGNFFFIKASFLLIICFLFFNFYIFKMSFPFPSLFLLSPLLFYFYSFELLYSLLLLITYVCLSHKPNVEYSFS